jgi:hypothetical protein
MANLPNNINGVTVEFKPTVDRTVVQSLIDGLNHCIRPDIAPGYILNKIFISSANDSHTFPSRHSQQKAADISRINGIFVKNGYPSNALVKAVVDAIQNTFETYVNKRENFGPLFIRKNGSKWIAAEHDDHVHLSVN